MNMMKSKKIRSSAFISTKKSVNSSKKIVLQNQKKELEKLSQHARAHKKYIDKISMNRIRGMRVEDSNNKKNNDDDKNDNGNDDKITFKRENFKSLFEDQK